ncbi:Cadherin-13 [Anabarilius grahami]|uniref:Cadherin-13 n=1 Tax=Anabarilius grahami TaxID=495550 RepID=A0A3N0YAW9_ANAGA|nr:Cadherin-13 [Anabarilius grahami]
MKEDHIFRLTGRGADQDPKGVFSINRLTGEVAVSRALDREAIAYYHQLSEGKPTAVQDVGLQFEEAVILHNVCEINDAAVSWPVRLSANVGCEFVCANTVV